MYKAIPVTFSLIYLMLNASRSSGAASYVVKLNHYINTEIAVKKGDHVTIRALGTVHFGLLAGEGHPNGINFGTAYNIFGKFKHGALIGTLGKEWFLVGKGTSLTATSNGVLKLNLNDNDSANNRGQFVVTININMNMNGGVLLKTHEQRYAELKEIRKSGDLEDLIRWLKENPDWTKGLPPLPVTLSEAKKHPDLWRIADANSRYHEGDKEVRQKHDVFGQKFPGVCAQGVYDEVGKLIPNEGTPDVVGPQDASLLHTPWKALPHKRTDVDLYNYYIVTYGPIGGEKRYRELYNSPLPSQRYNSPQMQQRQRAWEQNHP